MLEPEGPRYHRAAAAAAEILNLHFDPSKPKAELFGKILFTILAAMYAADEDLNTSRLRPSNN
jgi:hypothetical protein